MKSSQNLKSSSSTLTAHGDGTFHVASGEFGQNRTEHPSIGHALMSMAARHSSGPQYHVESTEEGFTTHGTGAQGKVMGPHTHETLGGVAKHMRNHMNTEDGATFE